MSTSTNTIRHRLIPITTSALPRPSLQGLVMVAVIAVTLYLVIVPLLFLLWSSFRSAPVGVSSPLTLENYLKVYRDARTYTLLGNTIVFATGSATIAIFLGVIFAWLLERTNIPLKDLIYSLIPVPMAIPGVLFSIGWVLLLSPTIGVVNLFLVGLLGLEQPPINIYSLGGMIFLEGLHLTPVTFLMMAGAFKSMDPALEEASATAGAGLFATLRRITLKVLRPSIFAALIYIFISAMESFEVPGVIGMRAGIHVLALKIYLAKEAIPPDYGMVGTLAVLLLSISALMVYFYGKITRASERYTTVTGKGYRPKMIDLGRWKHVALGLFFCYFILTVVLPLFILLWASLLPFYQAPSRKALSNLSLNNYWSLFDYPKVGLSIRNTLVMVLLAPTITMALCSIISWFIVKGEAKSRQALDIITILPHAIPGIVIGVSLMWAYLVLPIPIYGTIWILLVAYVTHRISFGTRVMNAAMVQLHRELEEASYASGGSWIRTFVRITLPLLIPAFLNGWIFSAIAVAKAMGSVIMIYSPESVVLPVLVWERWNEGDVPGTAALGVMMIVGLILATFVARKYGPQLLSQRL